MSTWGTGSFENDSAADFLAEVTEDGMVALEEAFEVILDPDMEYVEAEEGARAVAAAEIVAAGATGDTTRVTDAALRAWLDEQAPEDFQGLQPLAVRALDRVLSDDSELQDIWADSDDAETWANDVRRVLHALA
ncbi:DUF4259 domain-containing protein [Deinococcus maricopensis]|uniref:DUF4259 domain-containing protein n=1 Tax=Deinococcus maricopensis (strain DSM 21211 / LMG 22137 / NRRL B-23946 / LB-34) TaxID=709986 RepID=E8U8L4_DEIML|nr:DUF4259 domain-containing protein [Deinococcus maricopensis]ADV67403.1 hypothetical protein Deima_1754 [Deinococcus maricopensis DSM 21211]